MSGDSNKKVVAGAVHNIFAQNQQANAGKQKRFKKKGAKGPSKQELSLALTIILVDLASCDQNFDMQEYHVIAGILRKLFQVNNTEITGLIHRAKTALANLRGVSRYATLLKENLDEVEKKAILDAIDDLIEADGVEDGFETYFKHKLIALLGVK